MNNLTETLRAITDQTLPFSKICVVRRNSLDDLGNPIDLLYDCEPIDSPNYVDKTAFSVDANGVVTQIMTDAELKLSKQGWLYDVRLTAQADIETYKKNSTTDDTGIFQQPVIGSFVIVSFLNDTDAYISMISQAGNVKIKGAGGQEIDMNINEFVIANEKILKFTNSDVFQVINTRGVEFLIRDIISLQNENNYILVANNENGIEMNYSLDGGSIFSIQGTAASGSTPILFEMNENAKFSMSARGVNFKTSILDNFALTDEKILKVMSSINSAISSGVPSVTAQAAIVELLKLNTLLKKAITTMFD